MCFFILSFSDNDGNVLAFWKMFTIRSTKLNSKCPQERCEENFVLLREVFVLLFLIRTTSEIFWPSFKLFEHGCESCLRRVHKNNLKKFFGLLSIFFWTGLHPTYPEEQFEAKLFSRRKKVLLTLSETDWKNFWHLSNISRRDCENWLQREKLYILSTNKDA